jgi:hypothetical protein
MLLFCSLIIHFRSATDIGILHSLYNQATKKAV